MYNFNNTLKIYKDSNRRAFAQFMIKLLREVYEPLNRWTKIETETCKTYRAGVVNYEGDEIKVEIMFKTKGGTFESGIEGVKTQDFGSNSYTNDSGRWLELLADKNGSVADLISGYFANYIIDGNSGYEQVYFKTTYNGESKVFRFSLNGYYDAFQIFRKKWDENENPFDN